MAKKEEKAENKIYLDGAEITASQLQEAQNDPSKRIIEC